MKVLFVLLVLFVSGCGTMRGVGTLVAGIGSDIQEASDGYNKEYYNKHNR